jgi:hypothetical protein
MKKLLILAALAAFLLCALPSSATIALVQHTNKDCNTNVASCALAYGSNVTAGNLLVVVARTGQGTNETSITTSDTIGNSLTALTRIDDSTRQSGVGWYTCANASTAPDTVTIAVNTVNTSVRMAIYEYSGVATSGCLDTQSTGVGNSTSPAAGSIAPAGKNELIIAWDGINSATNQLAGTNFTLEDAVPANPNARLAVQDWVQPTATATTGAFAAIPALNWVENVAAFKPASGAAVPKCNSISLLGVGCY